MRVTQAQKLATNWLLKLYYTCQDCLHVYNRTKSCENVLSVGRISWFSGFVALNVNHAKNVKTIALFRMTHKYNMPFVPFSVGVNKEGMGPLDKHKNRSKNNNEVRKTEKSYWQAGAASAQ